MLARAVAGINVLVDRAYYQNTMVSLVSES
jgi:hypothetical protein